MQQFLKSICCDTLNFHADKLEAYKIKRGYQLLLVLFLQLLMHVSRLVATIQMEKADYWPKQTKMLFDGLNYSIFAISVMEWVLLLISFSMKKNIHWSCAFSIIAMIFGFVLRFAYLFIPYRDLVDLKDDAFAKTVHEWAWQLKIFLIFVLPLYIPNVLLLRSCKQAASYLAEYYEDPKENFFYVLSAIFTGIYLPVVTIAYGIIFFATKYCFNDYANYVPIAWMLWFVGSILEVYSVKPRRTLCAGLALGMTLTWWILVIIALNALGNLAWIIATCVGGFSQYLQLKLQLRDLFVMLGKYQKRETSGAELSQVLSITNQTQYEILQA